MVTISSFVHLQNWIFDPENLKKNQKLGKHSFGRLLWVLHKVNGNLWDNVVNILWINGLKVVDVLDLHRLCFG